MERLQGRRAFVTGAASGIGRATAQRLAREGAAVFCTDIAAEGAEETAKSIAAEGGTASAAIERGAEALGGLDLVANVAGILRPGHTHEQDPSVFDQTIAVNLTGTFNVCRAALPKLLEGGGSIVNIASAAALQGVPYNAAYCASKAGVVGLTRSLASEYARRDIRVNCICPGGVSTPMTAAGFPVEGLDPALMARIAPQMPKVAQPEEIAALVAYLSSEEAAYMTGSAITIDGGQLA